MRAELDCCPHCGSTAGYVRKIRLKAVRVTGWDGDPIDTDSYELTSQSGAKCYDCGKPVQATIDKNRRENVKS
jgi:hypothetical protein